MVYNTSENRSWTKFAIICRYVWYSGTWIFPKIIHLPFSSFLFVLWRFCTIYVYHIHSLSMPLIPNFTTCSNFYLLLCLFKIVKCSWFCLYTLGCGAFHWSVDTQPRAMHPWWKLSSLKEAVKFQWLLSYRCEVVSILTPCLGSQAWEGLMHLSQLLCILICICLAISRG